MESAGRAASEIIVSVISWLSNYEAPRYKNNAILPEGHKRLSPTVVIVVLIFSLSTA
jgi:hypothetical protein